MPLPRGIRIAVLGSSLLVPWALYSEDAPKTDKRGTELFQQLDKNQDGKLTEDEVPGERRRFFEHLLRVGDKDKNGVLTLEEFQAGIQAEEPARRPAPEAGERERRVEINPQQLFQRLDRNQDGKLSLDELPPAMRDRIGDALERRGKKDISQEEFLELAARFAREGAGREGGKGDAERLGERFRQLDANKDGKLTVEELPPEARERLAPVFAKTGKKEITPDDIAQVLFAGRGDRPRGEGEQPRREGDRPRGEGEQPRREGDRPRGEGEQPRREGDRPRGEGEQPRREGDRPRGEGEQPRREGDRPRGEGEQPRREGDRPRGEGEQPRRDGDRPRGEGEQPRREGFGPGRPGEFPPGFFRTIDTNRDGKISKEELRNALDRFEDLDKNRDGQLDPSELFGGPGRGRGDADGERPGAPGFRRPPPPGDAERGPERRSGDRPSGPPPERRPGERERERDTRDREKE